jgi:hypothetical protein
MWTVQSIFYVPGSRHPGIEGFTHFNQVTDTVDKFQKFCLIVKGILCYRAETKGLMK